MQVGAVDSRRADEQHRHLVRALEAAGADVVALPFVHGAFDSVFMKDNSVIVERASGAREALLAAPRHAVRQKEQRARAEALERHGIELAASSTHPLEGGDVVVVPDGGAFVGHGFRSSSRAAEDLEPFLGSPVIPVELRDPRLYHLDMALTVLDDGTALLCADALTPASVRAIEASDLVGEVLRVPLAEALSFGANLVQVGRSIVWGADAPRTGAALRARGYDLVDLNLDQFHLAGGSAACLVSRVHAPIRDVGRRAA